MLLIGGPATYTFVWDLGDVCVGLMTVLNIIVILPMSGQTLGSLRDCGGNMCLMVPCRPSTGAASYPFFTSFFSPVNGS